MFFRLTGSHEDGLFPVFFSLTKILSRKRFIEVYISSQAFFARVLYSRFHVKNGIVSFSSFEC